MGSTVPPAGVQVEKGTAPRFLPGAGRARGSAPVERDPEPDPVPDAEHLGRVLRVDGLARAEAGDLRTSGPRPAAQHAEAGVALEVTLDPLGHAPGEVEH